MGHAVGGLGAGHGGRGAEGTGHGLDVGGRVAGRGVGDLVVGLGGVAVLERSTGGSRVVGADRRGNPPW